MMQMRIGDRVCLVVLVVRDWRLTYGRAGVVLPFELQEPWDRSFWGGNYFSTQPWLEVAYDTRGLDCEGRIP